MQSKTQILEYKANTVKKYASRLRSNARMEISPCKKNKNKTNISTRNLHSSVFIIVIPSLQTLTGGIYTVETEQMLLQIFQLKKGQPGATPYSKVISWVKLSCVTQFKPLISAYLTTVGQNALKYTLKQRWLENTHQL